MEQIGKLIILFGVILIIVGVVVLFFDRIPLIGKLPGDIHIRRGNFNLYFPVMTSILLSVILTLVLWLVNNFTRR